MEDDEKALQAALGPGWAVDLIREPTLRCFCGTPVCRVERGYGVRFLRGSCLSLVVATPLTFLPDLIRRPGSARFAWKMGRTDPRLNESPWTSG